MKTQPMRIASSWGRLLTSGVLVVVGGLACAKDQVPAAASEPPKASGSTAAPAADENVCRNTKAKAKGEVDQTIALLRRLDGVRSQGYKPTFELPTRPTESACQTTFSKAPAKDEYEAAFRKVERNLDTFTAEFERNWGRIQLGPKAPATGSELASAASRDGAVPAIAACLISDVTGGCSRNCGTWAEYVCRNGEQQWIYACAAKASCAAEPSLKNTTTGLEYSSSEYVVEFRIGGVGEPAMKDFRAQIDKLKVGDAFRVPISAWRFGKTWVADADLSVGAPSVIE